MAAKHVLSDYYCGMNHRGVGRCRACSVCKEWVRGDQHYAECFGPPTYNGIPRCGKCDGLLTRMRTHDFTTNRISYGEWFCMTCNVKQLMDERKEQ